MKTWNDCDSHRTQGYFILCWKSGERLGFRKRRPRAHGDWLRRVFCEKERIMIRWPLHRFHCHRLQRQGWARLGRVRSAVWRSSTNSFTFTPARWRIAAGLVTGLSGARAAVLGRVVSATPLWSGSPESRAFVILTQPQPRQENEKTPAGI